MSASVPDSAFLAGLLPSPADGVVAGVAAGSAPGVAAWLALWLVPIYGFFVACHYAIEKTRGTDMDDVASRWSARRMRVARRISGQPESYLSATRFGMLASAILFGFAAARLLSPQAGATIAGLMPGAGSGWVLLLADLVVFLPALAALIVFGELVPKTLAIRHPVATVLRLGPPLHWLRRFLVPWVVPLEAAAYAILRRIFRVDPVREGEIIHTSEELQALVEETGGKSDVTETEREIVINALELSDLKVRDIMVPRHEVTCLDVGDPFEKCLQVAIDSRHTRFPVIRGHMDNTIGLIHIKDLLRISGTPEPDLMEIRRELLPVAEKMPLDQLLQFFLREHAHLAQVVDEYGGTLGVVFMDNVIEQLVGDIHDEFDEQETDFQRVNEDEFFVEGGMGLFELADHTDIEIDSSEVSTIGGYITQKLGHLPRHGESLEVGGHCLTVTKADGRRVLQVHGRRLPRIEGSGEDDASA